MRRCDADPCRDPRTRSDPGHPGVPGAAEGATYFASRVRDECRSRRLVVTCLRGANGGVRLLSARRGVSTLPPGPTGPSERLWVG